MLSDVTGRIDVHSHLLPGIDDGCATLDESLACARMLVEAGYTHSFCTPHIWPSLPNNVPPIIATKLRDLQQALDRNDIPLTLLPGGELNMTAATPLLSKSEVVSYGSAGRYALIDLWADVLPPFFEPAVRHLQSQGLRVILAHPERMRAVQDDWSLANYFADLGLLLQCNLQCLGDPLYTATRTIAEKYLHENRYFMFGSDLHNVNTLPIRLRGLKRAIEAAGEQKVWELTRENPKKLIG